MRIVALCLAALLSILAPGARARAQPSHTEEDARTLFQAGRAAYAAARWREAARNFENAYEISPRPELLYNMALSYEHLGEDALALRTFERFVAAAEEGQSRSDAEARIAELRARVEGPPGGAPDTTAAWVLLLAGLAVAAGGGALMIVGAVERGAVEGSRDAELEWADARDRLAVSDGLVVGGGVGLGVGVALAAVSLALFGSASSDVAVAVRGSGLELRGTF